VAVDRKARKALVLADIADVEAALRRWDPIGVLPGPGDDEGPMDEYDSYAPQLLGMLQRGTDASGLEARLTEIRTRQMGLPVNSKSDSRLASELVAWWQAKLER
jgi:hypothetical protein